MTDIAKLVSTLGLDVEYGPPMNQVLFEKERYLESHLRSVWDKQRELVEKEENNRLAIRRKTLLLESINILKGNHLNVSLETYDVEHGGIYDRRIISLVNFVLQYAGKNVASELDLAEGIASWRAMIGNRAVLAENREGIKNKNKEISVPLRSMAATIDMLWLVPLVIGRRFHNDVLSLIELSQSIFNHGITVYTGGGDVAAQFQTSESLHDILYNTHDFMRSRGFAKDFLYDVCTKDITIAQIEDCSVSKNAEYFDLWDNGD